MFYNTGIATYIWVLTNRKPEHRAGKVQLIDATQWFKPLRKNLGKKNCELSDDDIQRICDTFLAFEETEQSKIFPNAAFGYWKVTVERPLRLQGIDPERAYTPKEIKALKETARARRERAAGHQEDPQEGTAGRPAARPVRGDRSTASRAVVEYEPDTDLRDTEQVPLLEEGGIEAFLAREVLPHAPTPGIDPSSVKTGYEISFTRYFYKPQPLRTLEEIRADILALEKETEGLLGEIVGSGRVMTAAAQAVPGIQGLRACRGWATCQRIGTCGAAQVLMRERDAQIDRGPSSCCRVSQYTGVVCSDSDRHDGGERARYTSESHWSATSVCDQGDLVVNIMLAWHGSLGVSALSVGIVQPGVLRIRSSARSDQPAVLPRSVAFASYKAVSTPFVNGRSSRVRHATVLG